MFFIKFIISLASIASVASAILTSDVTSTFEARVSGKSFSYLKAGRSVPRELRRRRRPLQH